MTPPDALSPKLLLRARISDRRAETAMNQHQVGDHCVDHGQKREPVEDDNRWNGFESARGGGARQALYVPSSHALEALSFEAAFVWRLSIDSTGPITEGIGVLPSQRLGKPGLGIHPADDLARGEVDHMCAAAEGVQP